MMVVVILHRESFFLLKMMFLYFHKIVCKQAIINILYYCGSTSFVKDALLHRYFSPEVRASPMGAEVLMNYRRVGSPL